LIFNILYYFDELCKKGHDVIVEWYFHPDDRDMEEAGEIFASRYSGVWKMIKDVTMEF